MATPHVFVYVWQNFQHFRSTAVLLSVFFRANKRKSGPKSALNLEMQPFFIKAFTEYLISLTNDMEVARNSNYVKVWDWQRFTVGRRCSRFDHWLESSVDYKSVCDAADVDTATKPAVSVHSPLCMAVHVDCEGDQQPQSMQDSIHRTESSDHLILYHSILYTIIPSQL